MALIHIVVTILILLTIYGGYSLLKTVNTSNSSKRDKVFNNIMMTTLVIVISCMWVMLLPNGNHLIDNALSNIHNILYKELT